MDLYDNGVGTFLSSLYNLSFTEASLDVTMFQRSSTYVMSVKHGIKRVFGGSLMFFCETNMEIENLWN